MGKGPTLYRLATVGASRGLRGEVRLNLHTDNPSMRLAPGARVFTDPDVGTLTIANLTQRGSDWFAQFEGYPDRTAAQGLVHTVLLAEGAEEPDAWYARELTGLRAQRPTGEEIGTITDLEHYPAQDVLVVKEVGGQHTRVPLVKEIVPRIDVAEGVVIIDAPAGLLAADGEVE